MTTKRDSKEKIPLSFKKVVAPHETWAGWFVTALFQIFHGDFRMLGLWEHEDDETPNNVRNDITAIKKEAHAKFDKSKNG